MGDIGEWESVCRYRYQRRKRPPLKYILSELDLEIDGVNKLLDSFPKTKKVTVLQGNHDLWLDYFAEEEYECDPLKELYLFKNAIKIKERKWKYLTYGELYKIGKLYFYHGGHYSTIAHARQHVLNMGINILYAHNHDVQRVSISHAEGFRAAFCIGCLKKMDQKSNMWLKGRKTNWGSACAVIDFEKNGNFRCDIVDITAGKTTMWGKVIDGCKN